MQRARATPLYAQTGHQKQQEHSSIDFGPPSPTNHVAASAASAAAAAAAAHHPTEEDFELVREYEAGQRSAVLPTYSPRPGSALTAPADRAGGAGQGSGLGPGPSGIMASDSYDVSTSTSSHDSSSRRRMASSSAAADQGSLTDFSSVDSQPPRRFAAGGFNPYGVAGPALASAPVVGPNDGVYGEDKIAEKQRLAFMNSSLDSSLSPYARAGIEPLSDPMPPRRLVKPAPSVDEKRPGAGKYDKLIPVEQPPRSPLEIAKTLLDNDFLVTGIYFLLSFCTRLWKIGRSATVIWDEAHFGKFGSHYLKHEFYFDVHPPLGKMLVGLAGLLSGYNGQFEFKSGEKYPDDVNYLGMRVILAMFGILMVPVAYSTSANLGWNKRSRHLLALLVLFDNAWLVISRFILLDSMLLFFTFTTVHGLVKFHSYQHHSFSEPWWFWLTFTGISIGCVASVKWVGLFATALVGFYTIEDLWDKFGDVKMPVRTYARHWCARALCLIVVPMSVYMASFKLHFMILSRSGPGDAQMSSLFQAHLRGNDFAHSPLEAAFGSKVTFKNMGYGGGLLHSHVQTYPTGSQQQQVTCYHYKDNNNDFVITPRWEDPEVKDEDPPRMFKSGDVFRFVHNSTGRNLHSHTIPAPVTKENYEVSGYGNATVGDSNDYWVAEVVDDMITGKKGKVGDPIKSLTTRLRFRHQNLGCYMRAANAVLPQWGWKQVEVSCDKENNPKDDHTYWNIESHWNDKLPTGNAQLYRSPFLRDFIHLNVAMMTSNNALIPDADKEDILASKPLDWPWLFNGLRMNSWADNSVKYYLIGNPVIWWSSSASLIAFCALMLWYLGRMQRRHADLSPRDFNQFVFVGKIAGLGWFLHYLPFLIMARVCYIHHYLPTLYFAVLMLVHLLDHFLWNSSTARYRVRSRSASAQARAPLSELTKNVSFCLIAGTVVGVFWFFRGTAWGMDGPIWKYNGIKWRHSWNIKD